MQNELKNAQGKVVGFEARHDPVVVDPEKEGVDHSAGDHKPKIADTALAQTILSLNQALDDEIKAVKTDSGRHYEITNGRRVHSSGDVHLYTFKSDIALPIQPETPIEVVVNGMDPVKGVLIALQEFNVVILLEAFIGDQVPVAKVSAEPWFIYERLKGRLSDALDFPIERGEVAGQIIDTNTDCVGVDEDGTRDVQSLIEALGIPSLIPNKAQLEALSKCLGSKLHFVWGPPGTGKTAGLAQVVTGLVNKGEKVLVLAHANVAVDVAMLRVADALTGSEAFTSGKVLRIGTPQLPEALARSEILPEDIVAREQPALIDRKKSLEAQRKKLSKQLHKKKVESRRELAGELNAVRSELVIIKKALREALNQLLEEAQVVGSTLSRLAVDDGVWNWKADSVVVDEVSMALFPLVFAAAICAGSRLLIFGDFRQLPPIYRSRTQDARVWLGRDVFEVAGVSEKVDAGQDDPRVTLLDIQYRMAPAIADVVSCFAYQGRLLSGPRVADDVAPMSEYGIEPGSAVVLVDTRDLYPGCFREPKVSSYSRVNPLHALLAVSIAGRCSVEGSRDIGIVTPYRAQARIIAAASRDLGEDNGIITSATVHRFQGSEREVVIFDLVDAPYERGASMLTGRNAEISLRLINVALSRPKGKLIVLADCSFLEERHPRYSPALRAVKLLRKHGALTRMSPDGTVAMNLGETLRWSRSWEDAGPILAEDLMNQSGNSWTNFPEDFRPGKQLISAYAERSGKGDRTVVFAPKPIIREFENVSGIAGRDLQLQNRPGGFFSVVGESVIYLGGYRSDGPIARINSPHVVELLQRTLLGTSMIRRGPDANIEAELSQICGRCPDCGRERRPRLVKDSWQLRCSEPGHRGQPLDVSTLQRIVTALSVDCPDCGGPAMVRRTGEALFLGCPNFGNGCGGRPPRLQELFGG